MNTTQLADEITDKFNHAFKVVDIVQPGTLYGWKDEIRRILISVLNDISKKTKLEIKPGDVQAAQNWRDNEKYVKPGTVVVSSLADDSGFVYVRILFDIADIDETRKALYVPNTTMYKYDEKRAFDIYVKQLDSSAKKYEFNLKFKDIKATSNKSGNDDDDEFSNSKSMKFNIADSSGAKKFLKLINKNGNLPNYVEVNADLASKKVPAELFKIIKSDSGKSVFDLIAETVIDDYEAEYDRYHEEKQDAGYEDEDDRREDDEDVDEKDDYEGYDRAYEEIDVDDVKNYFYSDDNSKGDIFEYFNFDNSNEIDECIDIAEKFQKYGKKTGTVKITDAEAKDIVKFFKNANILLETSSYSSIVFNVK